MTISFSEKETRKLIAWMRQPESRWYNASFWGPRWKRKTEPAGYDLFYKVVNAKRQSWWMDVGGFRKEYKPGSMIEAARLDQSFNAGIYVYLDKREADIHADVEKVHARNTDLPRATAIENLEHIVFPVIRVRAHVTDLLACDGSTAVFRRVEVLDE